MSDDLIKRLSNIAADNGKRAGVHQMESTDVQETAADALFSNASSEDDFEPIEEPVQPESPGEDILTAEDVPETEQVDKPSIVTREQAEIGSRMAVDLLNSVLLRPVGRAVVSRRFTRKFTSEEIDRIESENLGDRTDLEDEGDKALQRKYNRLMKRMQEKQESMPIEDQERKDFESIMADYQQATGKTISPNIAILIKGLQILASRSYEAFTD